MGLLKFLADECRSAFGAEGNFYQLEVRIVEFGKQEVGGLFGIMFGAEVYGSTEDGRPFQVQAFGEAKEAAAERTEAGLFAQTQATVQVNGGDERTAPDLSRPHKRLFQMFGYEKDLFDQGFFRFWETEIVVRRKLKRRMEVDERSDGAGCFRKGC